MEATGADWLTALGWLGVPAALVLLWLLSRVLRDPGTAVDESDDLRPRRAGGDAASSPAPARRAADPLQADLQELLREGNKIAAIKRWRELTGLGLAEAKAAIDALERGQPLALPAADGGPAGGAAVVPPAPAAPSPLQETEIAALVRAGQKLEAIKRWREITGQGLKDSKEAVEALEARLRG